MVTHWMANKTKVKLQNDRLKQKAKDCFYIEDKKFMEGCIQSVPYKVFSSS